MTKHKLNEIMKGINKKYIVVTYQVNKGKKIDWMIQMSTNDKYDAETSAEIVNAYEDCSEKAVIITSQIII